MRLSEAEDPIEWYQPRWNTQSTRKRALNRRRKQTSFKREPLLSSFPAIVRRNRHIGAPPLPPPSFPPVLLLRAHRLLFSRLLNSFNAFPPHPLLPSSAPLLSGRRCCLCCTGFPVSRRYNHKTIRVYNLHRESAGNTTPRLPRSNPLSGAAACFATKRDVAPRGSKTNGCGVRVLFRRFKYRGEGVHKSDA